MNMNQTITYYIQKNAPIEIDDVSKAKSFVEDLGYDSIGLIQLVIDIEENLGIKFDDEQLNMDFLNDIDKFIEYIHIELSNKQ